MDIFARVVLVENFWIFSKLVSQKNTQKYQRKTKHKNSIRLRNDFVWLRILRIKLVQLMYTSVGYIYVDVICNAVFTTLQRFGSSRKVANHIGILVGKHHLINCQCQYNRKRHDRV